MTLQTVDGQPIWFRAYAGTPHWRFGARPTPRNWPTVRLRGQQRGFVWVNLTNWCRRKGERVRFRFTLPMGGGTLVATSSIRLRCESAKVPLAVGIGPFEPIS